MPTPLFDPHDGENVRVEEELRSKMRMLADSVSNDGRLGQSAIQVRQAPPRWRVPAIAAASIIVLAAGFAWLSFGSRATSSPTATPASSNPSLGSSGTSSVSSTDARESTSPSHPSPSRAAVPVDSVQLEGTWFVVALPGWSSADIARFSSDRVLSMHHGSLVAHDGCNTVKARYSISGSSGFRVSGLTSNLFGACAMFPYYAALQNTVSASFDGTRLRFDGADGMILITLSKLPPS
jgi:hypothetical protein